MSDAPSPGALIFKPVTRAPLLSDHVAAMILQTVTSRSMAPGDKLPSERELGEQFGVSRTVIREAVRALATKGIIEVRTGSGLWIAPVDASKVTESMTLFVRGMRLEYGKLHEVRALIEIEVAGLAAERADETDRGRLAENIELMKASVADEARLPELDVQFHREVAIATHNELHLVILDSIGDFMLEIRRATLSRKGRPREALAAHEKIANAISAQDAEAARSAMREHLDDSYRIWQVMSAESDAQPS